MRRVPLSVAVLIAAFAALVAPAVSRAAAVHGPAGLYYEAQTGPTSFALAELRLTPHRASRQVVALHSASIFGIAVDRHSIYWSTQNGLRDRGAILGASLAGGRPRRLVGGLTDAGSVVAVRGEVFWNDEHAIGRVAANGTHRIRKLFSLPAEAGGGVADGLASDGRYLYFSRCADHTIGRVDLNGRHVHPRFIALGPDSCPQGLAVAGDHIFWTELGHGAIGRARLNGRDADADWLKIDSRQGPFQVAAGDGHVYWTWGGENGAPSYTGRADTNRSHLVRRFLPDSMYPMAFAGES